MRLPMHMLATKPQKTSGRWLQAVDHQGAEQDGGRGRERDAEWGREER